MTTTTKPGKIPAAKLAPVTPTVPKGKPGKPPLTEAQKKERADKAAAFKALPPKGQAVEYVNAAWKKLEKLGEYLIRFDLAGNLKTYIGEMTESYGAIMDQLKTLPEDFKPARAARGAKSSGALVEGSEVFIKTGSMNRLSKHFGGNQGPHRVIEVGEDGSFVMLQGIKYAIGVERSQVSKLTPDQQAEAKAAWDAAHPDGVGRKGAAAKGNGKPAAKA